LRTWRRERRYKRFGYPVDRACSPKGGQALFNFTLSPRENSIFLAR